MACLRLQQAKCYHSVFKAASKDNLTSLRNSWLLSNNGPGRFKEKAALSTDVASFPSSAEIVVAGAGIVGSSVAYHLANSGKRDVIVLEQGSLGCGTTWHAVGLLAKLRANTLQHKMSSYGFDLYATLERETGLDTGVKRCGNVTVARTKDRAIFLRRLYDRARQLGVECDLISPKQAQDLYPIMKIDDLQLALWSPDEGVGNASDACASLMRGATNKGVQFFEGVGVKNVTTNGKRVVGVDTDRGFIHCEKFVNCGGQWSRELGLRSNTPVSVPLHSCEHFYVVTKPMEGVHSMLPALRDHDAYIYIREWSGGLMAGGFEPLGKACFYEKGVPGKFEFQLLQEDWEHFDILMQGMMNRIPSMENAEIRQFVNGPESFTPDGKFLFGEVPEVDNYFVAAGMNSGGISAGPAMGKLSAELITQGKCSWDTTAIDIKRFSKEENNKLFLRDRVRQVLGLHYAVGYPDLQFTASRPLKVSPLYDVLSQNGAKWGEIGGWERAKWFALDHKESVLTFGKPDWLKYVKEEYDACKTNVGLADLSWQSKFEITSDDESILVNEMQHLFAEDIDVKTGESVTSALLNEDGKYIATTTVHRLAENRFFLVTSPKQHNTLLWWIRKNLRTQDAISINDVSARYACLGLFGPSSMELLKNLTLASLEELRNGHLKIADLGTASDVIICRGCFKDENNWELFVRTELCRGLYKNIHKAESVKNIGHAAINTLRIEAGIPEFGSEIGPLISPVDTGKSSFANSEKLSEFIGKKALLNRDSASDKSLFTLEVDDIVDDNWVWGGEPVLADGESVGNLSSVSFSFSSGKLIALGVLQKQGVLGAENLTIQVAGQANRCSVLS